MKEIISTVSKKELIKFKKFINSDFTSQNKKVLKFVNFLLDSDIPDRNEFPGRDKIYKVVFDSDKYNDVNYRRFITDFKKAYKNFISISNFFEKPYEKEISIIEGLGKKRLFAEANKEIDEFKQELESKFARNSDFYTAVIKLYDIDYYYNFYDRKKEKNANLEIINSFMDFNFCFDKLHHLNCRFNHNIISKEQFTLDISFLQPILTFIKGNITVVKNQNPNLYLVYLNSLYNMNNSDVKFLTKYKKYLFNNCLKFDKHTNHFYYNYLISLYAERVNKGEFNYRKEVLDCYDKMIEGEFYIIDDYVLDNEFNNAVITAIGLKKFDWAENYINSFKTKLNPEVSESVVNINLAKIYFNKKNLEKTLLCLDKIDSHDPYYFINAKMLLARVYVEKGELYLIDSVLDSLNKYCKRNKKISEKFSKSAEIFVRYIKKFVKAGEDEFKLHLLRKELSDTSVVVNYKSWLLEQVEKKLSKKQFKIVVQK